MSNIPKDLPERIKYLREQKEMSQSDLAKRIGIDASRLSRIENGEIQKVSDDVVLAIAQIFEVSTDFLLGVTDDPVPSNFHINELGRINTPLSSEFLGAHMESILVCCKKHCDLIIYQLEKISVARQNVAFSFFFAPVRHFCYRALNIVGFISGKLKHVYSH